MPLAPIAAAVDRSGLEEALRNLGRGLEDASARAATAAAQAGYSYNAASGGFTPMVDASSGIESLESLQVCARCLP